MSVAQQRTFAYLGKGQIQMGEFPKGGLIGKTVGFFRAVARLRVSVYAANACYFIVLSLFPSLILLLSLLLTLKI